MALRKGEFQKGIEKSKFNISPEQQLMSCKIISSIAKKVLHIGNKGKVNEPYKVVLLKLLDLKKFIEKTLPESTVFISPFLDFPVFISNLFTQADNGKASLTVIKTDKHSYSLQLDVIDNENITSNE